jgi:hypothetical protein
MHGHEIRGRWLSDCDCELVVDRYVWALYAVHLVYTDAKTNNYHGVQLCV